MNGRTAQALLAVVVGFALAGCASGSPLARSTGGPSTSMPLVPTSTPTRSAPSVANSIDGNWQLTRGKDSTGSLDIDQTVITLIVNGSDSSGKAPCNAYGLRIVGGSVGAIAIKMGIHTEMACADPRKNMLEMRYFTALNRVAQAALKGQELVLTGGGVELDFAPSAAAS